MPDAVYPAGGGTRLHGLSHLLDNTARPLVIGGAPGGQSGLCQCGMGVGYRV